MKTITITVKPNGETNIETHGYFGTDCREATRPFEQALGKHLNESFTQEMFILPTTEKTKLSQ